MNKPKGFSLIELLVVIAIIGLLSTMAVVSLNNARQKARDARRQGDLKSLQTAIEMYKTQQASNDTPPLNTSTAVTWADLSTALAGLLTSAPTDPNNTGIYTYVYCRDTAANNTNNGYILAANMEQKVAVQGDLDIAPSASSYISGTVGCIQSGTATLTAYASMSCADGAGNLTAANQYVFCLGQKSNP